MPYSEVQIERIVDLAGNPANLQPADRGAWELSRQLASAVADTYTDDDWRHVLNTLSPSRAAIQIASRPAADHDRLLMLIGADRRGEIQSLLASLAA